MRALLQRVQTASVEIDGEIAGKIGPGLLVLLGIRADDTEAEADYLADKCLGLRIFGDKDGKFNLSVSDVTGDILVVSQFTLYADTRRGRRPSFTQAAPPELAERLYERFVRRVRSSGLKTETGEFGAMMNVSLVNDGPVTVMVERDSD